MGPEDLDALRRHGFDDDQITIATQVIAYFNYINRIADALGVDPEDGMTPPRDEWEQRKGRGGRGKKSDRPGVDGAVDGAKGRSAT